VIKLRKKPIIYLDTNVLRDCVTKRNYNSIHLMNFIKKKKWRCVTSTFSIMELHDTEKDYEFFIKKIKEGYEINEILSARRQINLNEMSLLKITGKIDMFLEKYKFLETWNLERDDDWVLANIISSSTNLSAEDSIHLATAFMTGSNLIVTRDGHFKKEGETFIKENGLWDKIRICEPEKAIDTLREMGFEI